MTDSATSDDAPRCPDCDLVLVCVAKHLPVRQPVQDFEPPKPGQGVDKLMRYLFDDELNGREMVDALKEDYGVFVQPAGRLGKARPPTYPRCEPRQRRPGPWCCGACSSNKATTG